MIHISGTLTWSEIEAFKEALPETLQAFYRPYPYLHERMGAAFRAADLVVSRAGAGMLGEAPVFGTPAILIPLAFAWRYQKVNADFLCQQGAAIQLTDEQLPQQLLPTVMNLIQDKPQLLKMKNATHALDQPSAAINLARMLLALTHHYQQEVNVGA